MQLEEIVVNGEGVLEEISTPSTPQEYGKLLQAIEKKYLDLKKHVDAITENIYKLHRRAKKEYALTQNKEAIVHNAKELEQRWYTQVQALLPETDIRKNVPKAPPVSALKHLPTTCYTTAISNKLSLSKKDKERCHEYLVKYNKVEQRMQKVLASYDSDTFADGGYGMLASCAAGGILAGIGALTGGVALYTVAGLVALTGSGAGPLVGYFPRRWWKQRKQKKAFKREFAQLHEQTLKEWRKQ